MRITCLSGGENIATLPPDLPVKRLVLSHGDHLNSCKPQIHQPGIFPCKGILGRSIHTLKENAEALVAATREIGLEVSADKTKYMVMSRDQNAGQSHSVRTDNSTEWD